jgi:hypothetical protein
MTKEEFDKLDDNIKKYFAKEGDELRPITEMTKEDLIRIGEMYVTNIPDPEHWGLDESGHMQLIDTSYGGIS